VHNKCTGNDNWSFSIVDLQSVNVVLGCTSSLLDYPAVVAAFKNGDAEINTSIVQGSGIGPMLFVVMESDLSIMSSTNILLKYADDTSAI